MKRALVLLVTLIGLAVARPALAKPSIAVLGLEVVEESDTPDAKAAAFAEALTEALRQRARLGTGPFTLAAGSDKNLIEMNLLSGCDSEANGCMAAIGAELAADRLLYGRIQKNGSNYQISLKLLNVDTKSIERTTSDLAPVGESSTANLSALGKKLYAKITGVSNQATLIVKANVATGSVSLDGEPKGQLVGGALRIEGLAAGDYKLTVESECYLSHEGKVSVEGGRDVTEPVELEKNAAGDCGGTDNGNRDNGNRDNGHRDSRRIISGGVSLDERPGGGARAMFWATAAVTAVGAGVWGYGYFGMIGKAQDNLVNAENGDGDKNVCEGTSRDRYTADCDKGDRGRLFTQIGIPITIVAGAAAGYFFYRGYVSAPKANERALNARNPRRNNLSVAPVVTATTVGGVLHLEF